MPADQERAGLFLTVNPPKLRRSRRPIQQPELQDPELRRAFESPIEAWGCAPR
jgi:hypothetical protein